MKNDLIIICLSYSYAESKRLSHKKSNIVQLDFYEGNNKEMKKLYNISEIQVLPRDFQFFWINEHFFIILGVNDYNKTINQINIYEIKICPKFWCKKIY